MKRLLGLALLMMTLGMSDKERDIIRDKTLATMRKILVNEGYVSGWCKSDIKRGPSSAPEPAMHASTFGESYHIEENEGCIVHFRRWLWTRPLESCESAKSCKRGYRQEQSRYSVNLALLSPKVTVVDHMNYETKAMPLMNPAKRACDNTLRREKDPSRKDDTPVYDKDDLVYAVESLPGKMAFFAERVVDESEQRWSKETLFMTTNQLMFDEGKNAWETMIRMCQKP